MIQFLLIAFLVTALAAAAAIIAAVIQSKKAKQAETRLEALHTAFRQVKEKAERLQKAIGENAKAGEQADEERKNLERTPDSGLAGRANALFGGMPDGGNGKRGSAGDAENAGPAPAGEA